MTPAGTTHYVYDLAGHLIAEATDTGTTVREYVWLDDMPLAVVADVDTMAPHLYYVHADHLDRPLRMTDATEAVVWDAVYKPFGEVVSITGAASNNLRFPGQYFLIEAGLHYNWYRHYDPTLGRYTQPDPLGFVDGPSVFAYGRSAPTMYVDQTGQCPWCVAAVVGFGVGAGFDFASQYWANGGHLACIDWWQVGSAGLFGAVGGVAVEGVAGLIAARAGGLISVAGKVVGNESGGIAGYTRHGLNEAISGDGVGVAPQAILDTVRNPQIVSSGGRGAVKYTGKNAVVVVNSQGKVVTTWPTTSAGFRTPR